MAMKVLCGVCRNKTDSGSAEEVRLGQGVSQYVCGGCRYRGFNVVMRRLKKGGSPKYLKGKLVEG